MHLLASKNILISYRFYGGTFIHILQPFLPHEKSCDSQNLQLFAYSYYYSQHKILLIHNYFATLSI